MVSASQCLGFQGSSGHVQGEGLVQRLLWNSQVAQGEGDMIPNVRLESQNLLQSCGRPNPLQPGRWTQS